MNTQIIQFNGRDIIAELENNVLYVAIRPICEAIGLDAKSALRNIKNDEILGGVVCSRTLHDASNRLQEMLCMPIQYLNGWLFSLQINKVKEEIRPTLLKYKKECYEVLFNHFFGSSNVVKSNTEQLFFWEEKKRKINRVINKLMVAHKEVDYQITKLKNQNYKQLGLEFYKPKQNGLVPHSQTALA